jgi:hypothetical protein
MSTLESYLTQKKIKPQTLLNKSAAIELAGDEDQELLAKRAEHRAKAQNGNYGEANLAKPKSGRGLSKLQLEELMAGKPASKRARAKLVRALAAIAGEGADLAALKKLVAPVPPKKDKSAEGETAAE